MSFSLIPLQSDLRATLAFGECTEKEQAGCSVIHSTWKINIDLVAMTLLTAPPPIHGFLLLTFSLFYLKKKKKKDIGISLEKLTNDSCKHNNTTDQ